MPTVCSCTPSSAAGDARLEKFYHYWFTSDVHTVELIEELGQSAEVELRPTRTGTYHAHDFFKPSTPLDLLHFLPPPSPARGHVGTFDWFATQGLRRLWRLR